MEAISIKMQAHAGCLAKMPPLELHGALEKGYNLALGSSSDNPMSQPEDSVLLDIEGQRFLATTDFGPLVGTNAAEAGRIAALHAMSDIYASGGIPKHAIAILVVGQGESDSQSLLVEHLTAALVHTCSEEGVSLKSGHTITGPESMIGLTVMGMPREGIILRKQGANIGDNLLLSKPLGLGIMIKARQLQLINNNEFQEALRWMMLSNREASINAVQARVHAATDVTGFGLLGHLSEMLRPGQGATLDLPKVPVLERIGSLPQQIGCGLADRNAWYVRSRFRLKGYQENARYYPLADPQTNGGLLVAADAAATAMLTGKGFQTIGRIVETPNIITITNGDD